MLKILQEKMPETQKQFLDDVNKTTFVEIGDYLFTHAGVNPEKSLEAQGLRGDKPLTDLEKIERTDIPDRNAFMWRDNLPNCDKVVVHGHTPSAITQNIGPNGDTMVVADPQKPYRLCIDTAVYGTGGALTSLVLDNTTGKTQHSFMAVNNNTLGKSPQLISYATPDPKQALEQHAAEFPQYHPSFTETDTQKNLYHGQLQSIAQEAKMTGNTGAWAAFAGAPRGVRYR